MTTSAVSPNLFALYLSDPDAVSTTMENQELVDSGDHLVYQAAWAYRAWDEGETLTIEKQTGGEGEWAEVSSGFTVDYLLGKITFAAEQGATDLFRATGKRFAPVQVLGCTSSKISINHKIIDVSDMADTWDECIAGRVGWSITTDMWWLCTDDAPAQDYFAYLGDKDLFIQWYPYNSTNKRRYVGRCILEAQDVSGAGEDAAKQSITIRGDNALEVDTYTA